MASPEPTPTQWRWLSSLTDDDADMADQVPVLASDRPLRSVPRWIAELAHEDYARRYDQSFDRLHERGGFSANELIGHLAAALRRERQRRD
jgi:hypothetical protein